MLIPPVSAFGHPPAQVEDAAGDKDSQKPLDRWRDRFRLEVHDDGLTKDVGKAAFRNAAEARKDGLAEMDLRMPPSRFGQKSFRRIKAFRRITVSIEPAGVTPTAATDICR